VTGLVLFVRSVHRITTGAIAALLATVILCQPAFGDADPASDVLLGASVFYPYAPPVSPSVEKALNGEVAAAAHAHFPIKVALIGSPVDLGAIPTLFDEPQKYAAFLDQEISFSSKQMLLVVMPNGFGVAGLDPAATSAAGSLSKPARTGSDAIARAAIAAIARLAAASGHPLTNVASPTGSASGGGSSALVPVVVLVVVALGASAAAIVVRHRMARRRAT
jgi:hypothetical protein